MKKVAVLVSILLLLGISIFYLFENSFLSLRMKLKDIETPITQSVAKIVKEISIPPPLIAKDESYRSFLTKAGVFTWTNIQRSKNSNLPMLIPSMALNQIAELRFQDMFQKQYFAHVSPEGIEVSDVAQTLGYEFISLGENLALGNFEDDEVLVQAWMNSPGHRENILNHNYTEIGIAVGRDLYEGKNTWIGVQIFARPLSSCPQSDPLLETKIDTNNEIFKNLEAKTHVLLDELKSIRKQRGNREEYNQKVDEYNVLVGQINNLVAEIKIDIETYNNQVELFNVCILG